MKAVMISRVLIIKGKYRKLHPVGQTNNIATAMQLIREHVGDWIPTSQLKQGVPVSTPPAAKAVLKDLRDVGQIPLVTAPPGGSRCHTTAYVATQVDLK